MPDLLAISRDTLQMQQHHERLEPRIGGCRVVAHSLSPGFDAASSVWLSKQRLVLGHHWISNRRLTLGIVNLLGRGDRLFGLPELLLCFGLRRHRFTGTLPEPCGLLDLR